MSTSCTRSSRRSNTPARIQCKFPGCRRWFGNKSGLTKHTNRFHPAFLVGIPSNLTSGGGASATEQDDGSFDPHTAAGVDGEGEDVEGVDDAAEDSRWHGPNAKVYRNYHPELTGA